MCGIFASYSDGENVMERFMSMKGRGPDKCTLRYINDLVLGFHRLKINDMSSLGDQPFYLDGNFLVCNGEIYNHEELRETYKLKTTSHSDCEVILHLFRMLGFNQTVNLLDGVFSIIIYDSNNDVMWVARDPFGVRPLFQNTKMEFASEAKALDGEITQVEPGSITCIRRKTGDMNMIKYFPFTSTSTHTAGDYDRIRGLLIKAVKKRTISDRPIGCLLSGGFDSSIIASILVQELGYRDLQTFSIGMKGSVDLENAKTVAKFLGIDRTHHSIELSSSDFLDAIPETVKQIESYDTTTVRASVGMYLLSKYISENTDIKVIYSGEGADEVCLGYKYFHNAPNPWEGHRESVRLLNDLHLFDVLRSDRTTAAWGLEIRVPFLDKEFVNYYKNIIPDEKVCIRGIEKYTLRKSFEIGQWLPDSILWRSKEAFSDGVSSVEKSWHRIIQHLVEHCWTREEFENKSKKYNPRPLTKEALYYRELYDVFYKDSLIPYYWLPKWCGEQVDPSARELDNY